MVLTMRIIFLVGKINMHLPKSKEGNECGVILMIETKREQFERFLCLLGSKQNRWINFILIDVKTPEYILYYLGPCVKEEIQV